MTITADSLTPRQRAQREFLIRQLVDAGRALQAMLQAATDPSERRDADHAFRCVAAAVNILDAVFVADLDCEPGA